MDYERIIAKLKEESSVIIPQTDLNSEIIDKLRRTYEDDKVMLEKLAKEDSWIKKGIKLKKESLQLILAFDTTGSMAEYRGVVRKEFDYIATNLTDMLEDVQIAFAGVGEYCDKPNTLQLRKFTANLSDMKRDLNSIKDTKGGKPYQVSLELLFQELNKWHYNNCARCLVVVSDQIPHGMDNEEKHPKADYRKELEELKKKMNLYFVSATGHYNKSDAIKMKDMQYTMVDHDKYFLDLEKIERLPTLIVGMCMSEVGRLSYMMGNIERK